MAEALKLTQGKYTIVDDEDYEFLSQWKWHLNNEYAARMSKKSDGGKHRLILMHRVILKTPDGMDTYHINMDGLDNRKKNLRIATRSQNKANVSERSNNTSGHKGVSWYWSRNKWNVRIQNKGVTIHVGYYDDFEDAVEAYRAKALELNGEFARV